MDEDGNFTYKKPEPQAEQQPEGEGDKPTEKDPLAGSNLTKEI